MDEEAGELVAFGFDDDERYRRDKRRRERHYNVTGYLGGHALRHLTDDPEDKVWELA